MQPFQPIEGEEPNPFAGFEAGEVFGFIHHKYGEDGLRELLAIMDDSDLNREFLERAASELEDAGLSKPAAIVAEIAATKPSGLDLDNPHPEGSEYWHHLREDWLKRRRIQTGEMEADFRRRHSTKKRKRQRS